MSFLLLAHCENIAVKKIMQSFANGVKYTVCSEITKGEVIIDRTQRFALQCLNTCYL